MIHVCSASQQQDPYDMGELLWAFFGSLTGKEEEKQRMKTIFTNIVEKGMQKGDQHENRPRSNMQ